jgi:hypothetical protein
VKDPKDAHECGRIHYQISMFRGAELSHPSGDWMIAWCGRQHLKFEKTEERGAAPSGMHVVDTFGARRTGGLGEV